MQIALELAREAAADGETPVGCVITDVSGSIIGRGRNRREHSHDIAAHAEIEAMRSAASSRGDWRLDGCTLYVTLEPCAMCAGAIVSARIGSVYFGARDDFTGTRANALNLFAELPGASVAVTGGILADECAVVLSEFFRELRE